MLVMICLALGAFITLALADKGEGPIDPWTKVVGAVLLFLLVWGGLGLGS